MEFGQASYKDLCEVKDAEQRLKDRLSKVTAPDDIKREVSTCSDMDQGHACMT
jgi:hypothetical protein